MGWPYRQKPPMGWPLDYDSGLVPDAGFWPMWEGSGNKVFDLSGNGRTGTLFADAHFVPGKYGSALDFDGTGDYAFLGTITGLNDYTFVISAKHNDPSTNNHDIFRADNNASPRDILYLKSYAVGNGGTIIVADVDDTLDTYTNWAWPANTWRHFVFARRGTSVYIYFDGILVDTLTVGAGIVDLHELALGCYYNNGSPSEFSICQIDHVSIYNRTLSAFESAQLSSKHWYMFKDPAEIALLGGYQAVVGAAGIMTTNTGYWGPTY